MAEFKSNKAQVLAQLEQNVKRASDAIGTAAVGAIVGQMQGGYGRPIRQTGDLMRDVNYKAETSGSDAKVTVGNGLEYAVHVHEGTSKMGGRPYIKDGIMGNADRLKAVWEQYLKEGF